NLWVGGFFDAGNNFNGSAARITPQGAITIFDPFNLFLDFFGFSNNGIITSGADGSLWSGNDAINTQGALDSVTGNIFTNTVFNTFSIAAIATVPDKRLWITQPASGQISLHSANSGNSQ